MKHYLSQQTPKHPTNVWSFHVPTDFDDEAPLRGFSEIFSAQKKKEVKKKKKDGELIKLRQRERERVQ